VAGVGLDESWLSLAEEALSICCLQPLPRCYRTQPNGAELAGRERDKKTQKSETYVLRVRLGLGENCLLDSGDSTGKRANGGETLLVSEVIFQPSSFGLLYLALSHFSAQFFRGTHELATHVPSRPAQRSRFKYRSLVKLKVQRPRRAFAP
jgi:hypothetical protein